MRLITKAAFYKSEYLKVLLAVISVFIFAANARSTTFTVTVQNFEFIPGNISVNVGDTVKWQWVNGNHTTTCDGVTPGTTLPPGAAPWNATMSSGSPTFVYVITAAGNYNYVCIPHSPGMAGTITASGGGSGILLNENFDYPAGDSLGAHGWVSFSGGSTNVLTVTSPGMTYGGYPLSGIGNATTIATSGQDAYKNFSQPDSTGSIYVSFMVKITSAQTAGDYFFALLPPTSTTLYTARFYAKDSSGGLAFGLSKSTAAAGGIFYTGGTYSYGTTYLVVIKYQFNSSTADDVMNAFIFSSGVPATEPGTVTIGPVTGTASDNALGRIAIRQGSTANAAVANLDGYRVSKSWSGMLTGVKVNSTVIADKFTLSQNYPNPFNPNTTIKFNLPESGFVNLTVYNSLGREINNLVNENINSGSYSVDFNGSGLNSGVYFYKLTFSDNKGNFFSDTKKLILIK